MNYLERTINKLYEMDSLETHRELVLCVKDAAEILTLALDELSEGLAYTEVADLIEELYNYSELTDISEIIHELELINMEI